MSTEVVDAKELDKVYKITDWIKDYVHKSGFKRVVLGLSGGLDSAVVAALAAKALGPENVTGVTMPCYSSKESTIRATKLVEQLGIKCEHIPLERLFSAFEDTLDMSTEDEKLRNLAGNIKARMRMTILYAVNEEYGDSLVIGTGNFSERFMGYFTKWGDEACDLNPIGSMTKTRVRKIAKLLEIPQEIIDAAPSADLWEGQTDEEELGAPYEDIDKYIIRGNKPSMIPNWSNIKTHRDKIQHKLSPPPIFLDEDHIIE